MKNIQAHLDKIRSDAAECLLLSNIAPDGKREVFTKMAEHLNGLALEVQKTVPINDRAAVAGTGGDHETLAAEDETVAAKIAPSKQARRHVMLPWLLMGALGITMAFFWTYKPVERYWSSLSSLQAEHEPSSAPQDNSKQALAAILSDERADRQLVSEQIKALAQRLDDLEGTLNSLKNARAETAKPLNTETVGAEEKPSVAETSSRKRRYRLH